MGVDIKAKKPLIIAGPCSVESREQIISTAMALAATKRVDILRACTLVIKLT